MKKTLASLTAPNQTPNTPPVLPRRTAPVRLVSALTLLGLVAGLGLLASRPAHTVGGPVAVSVANTVLTVPTDETAPKQPFTGQITCRIVSGSTAVFGADIADGYSDIKVPTGKRLVIQAVSLEHENLSNETLLPELIAATNGNVSFYPLTSVPSNGTSFNGMTQSLTLYADGGSTVTFGIYRSQSTGSEYIHLTVSGYLVNA